MLGLLDILKNCPGRSFSAVVIPSLLVFKYELQMKIRLAQYGISHDHAAGKARVMRESDEVEFCGVFEPSVEVRETLGTDPVYEGVHWFAKKEEILEDESIVCIAAEGGVSQTSPLRVRPWSAVSTSGSTSRQAMIWRNFGQCSI